MMCCCWPALWRVRVLELDADVVLVELLVDVLVLGALLVDVLVLDGLLRAHHLRCSAPN